MAAAVVQAGPVAGQGPAFRDWGASDDGLQVVITGGPDDPDKVTGGPDVPVVRLPAPTGTAKISHRLRKKLQDAAAKVGPDAGGAQTTHRVLLLLNAGSKAPAKLRPDLDPKLPHSHPINLARLRQAESEAVRATAAHVRRAQLLLKKKGIAEAKVVQGFALIPAVVTELRAAEIGSLLDASAVDAAGVNTTVAFLDDADARAVNAQASGTCTGPVDTNLNNNPKEARRQTTADKFYKAQPLFNSRVGVVDTGLATFHPLVANRVAYWGDCNTGGPFCCRRTVLNAAPLDSCTNYGDPSWNDYHGTPAVALVTGGSNCLDAYRGATSHQADFFGGGVIGHTLFSMVKAFQAAVLTGDSVVSVSWHLAGIPSGEFGPAALAADALADLQLFVFAAAGNEGCAAACSGTTCSTPIPTSIPEPAVAHTVIAVGAYDVSSHTSTTKLISPSPECYSGRGPAADGRTKPDILGPTNVETADVTTTTKDMAVFSGTSAATSNVAGAFISFYTWMINTYLNTENGPLYGHFMASIFAAGQNFAGTGATDNKRGAGTYRPGERTGSRSWGTVTLIKPAAGASAPYKDITLSLTASTSRDLRCAIWWNERASNYVYNNVDLTLYSPSGTQLQKSASALGVWERVGTKNIASTGKYKIRITGRTLESASVEVHWWCFR